MRLTLQEKREKVRDMRPIDDVFFEVLASSKAVCQEMLRTILTDAALEVEDVVVQSSERNLYGRSVRLDALCTLGDGTKCNIEVQRADNDDHLRRARYNAASITTRESIPGERFREVVEVCIVYITEKDFLQGNQTIYHMDKIMRETGQTVDDGLREIFVNAAVDDRTDIAGLMKCFMQTAVDDRRFPALSSEVKRLKEDERGVTAVCEVMQRYEAIARAEGRETGRKEGQNQLVNAIDRLRAGEAPEALLADGVDERTVELAKAYS